MEAHHIKIRVYIMQFLCYCVNDEVPVPLRNTRRTRKPSRQCVRQNYRVFFSHLCMSSYELACCDYGALYEANEYHELALRLAY